MVYGEPDSFTYIVESMATGCAFFDYDNDGWMDIFIPGGRRLENTPPEASNRLYKNNRDGTFTDVTAKAGLLGIGWAQGVCVGDYNNDGFEDLFLTYYGQNKLYRNNGDGTFTDVTAKAGLLHPTARYSTGCTFVDYNRDGLLDLFVSNYLEIDLATAPKPSMAVPNCNFQGVPTMCGPEGLPKARHYLYRNNGDGAFTDVSQESGVAGARRSHRPRARASSAPDASPGQQEVRRRLPSHHGRQRDGQREAVMEAQPREVGAEAALRRGHPEVGGSARPQPPPMAAPCTAATTGSGAAKSRSAASYSAAMSWSALPAKSRPAQKCRPSDARTIARHQPERVEFLVRHGDAPRGGRCRRSCWAAGAWHDPDVLAVLLHRDVGPAHRAAPPRRCPPSCASRSPRPRRRRLWAPVPTPRSRARGTCRGRVGLEDEVEHHGVEAEAARLAQRVLHQRPPHTGAPVRRRDEIAGIGDVRVRPTKLGLM